MNEREIYHYIAQSGKHGRTGNEVIQFAQSLGGKTREIGKILIRLEYHDFLVSENDMQRIYQHSLDYYDFAE
jgi:hypothetical protein